MIVDDHEEIRSIARMARNWGHEVALAKTARVRSLAEAFQPEYAVVDLSLPGMTD
jgi:CheY-like chemotaxis protein